MQHVQVVSLFIILLTTASTLDSRDDGVKAFEAWFKEHGGRCRCNFTTDEDGETAVIADRPIQDGEATLMVPQTILLNATAIESSPVGPSLEILSLTEALISKEQDVDKQAIMHLTQMAIYLLYSIQVNDENWLPFSKLILSTECKALWSWSKSDLTELQDDALMKRALKWQEEISTLTNKISPKLKELGLFAQGIEPKKLTNGICAVQRNIFNITSDPNPTMALVPGLNMFPYHPGVVSTWWTKGGALRYRYVARNVQRGEKLHINMNPSGDGIQTLFDYGFFIADGTKFTNDLPAPNSEMRRRLSEKLKIRNQIRYSSRFTFKSAALPYFRVKALSDKEVEELVKDFSNSKLSDLSQVIKSPTLHTHSKPEFSCKEEVVALNTLSLHLRDALNGKVTAIKQDEEVLSKADISERRRIAVSFRLTFKKLVTKFLDFVSARTIEVKRECLSRKRDEL